ncbi:hypothetical protein [Brevibacillus brevis]|uniref:hypothetical protein n=1 Tax=Brevibacillus brevis TaxID=1393 RepID=UPI00163D3ABF|nr:hypothetical protein [Lysinibacillus sp. SDF0063]
MESAWPTIASSGDGPPFMVDFARLRRRGAPLHARSLTAWLIIEAFALQDMLKCARMVVERPRDAYLIKKQECYTP